MFVIHVLFIFSRHHGCSRNGGNLHIDMQHSILVEPVQTTPSHLSCRLVVTVLEYGPAIFTALLERGQGQRHSAKKPYMRKSRKATRKSRILLCLLERCSLIARHRGQRKRDFLPPAMYFFIRRGRMAGSKPFLSREPLFPAARNSLPAQTKLLVYYPSLPITVCGGKKFFLPLPSPIFDLVYVQLICSFRYR